MIKDQGKAIGFEFGPGDLIKTQEIVFRLLHAHDVYVSKYTRESLKISYKQETLYEKSVYYKTGRPTYNGSGRVNLYSRPDWHKPLFAFYKHTDHRANWDLEHLVLVPLDQAEASMDFWLLFNA